MEFRYEILKKYPDPDQVSDLKKNCGSKPNSVDFFNT